MLESKRLSIIALGTGLAFCLVAGGAAMAQVQPGDVITKKNVQKIKGLVSPGIEWAVAHGMDLEIVPYRRIYPPSAYQDATEQYSDQSWLDEANIMYDWVAGSPFPVIDPTDPQAAPKIMYNFERRFQQSDDIHVAQVDGETGQILISASGDVNYHIERSFLAEWSRVLNFQGRLYNEPKPEIMDNPDATFRKFGFYPLVEPFDIKGVGSINYRYLDPARFDDTWFYIPIVRRVRRISVAQRSDALFGQDIDVDSFSGYAGQIPWFEWRLVGEKPMLGSFHSEKMPGELCEGNGGATICDVWEMRPKMYIIEGLPKLASYAYSKRLLYVESETYTIPFTDMFDKSGEMWKTLHYTSRYDTKPNPNTDLEYEEPQIFPYALSIIDIQALHATRFQIPGLAFPNESGWYLNASAGDGVNVGQDWYSIAALVSGGR